MSYEPKLLRVDLSKGTFHEEAILLPKVRDFVGGRGLAAAYLYEELPPGVDPLGPGNKLVFSVGPLAGTSALSFSRWMVTSKSPLTGTYFRSVGGADFGAWLRWTGFDLLIIEGKADEPSYLHIEESRPELRPAAGLWGKGTAETQQELQSRHNGSRIACIGTAGEKLVRYAGIFSASNSASRGGLGAVMGSKNLKAIAINASRKPRIAEPDKFKELVKEQAAGITKSRAFESFSTYGTSYNQDNINRMGIFATRNSREGSLTGWQAFSGDEYAKLKEGNFSCYACPVHCGNRHKAPGGRYQGAASDGPDFQTIWAFTGPAASTDIAATIAANALCDDVGMDTISAGSTIGFAFELFEKGLLTKADTGGLDLSYGNHEAMMELLKKIALREGIGDLLAEGVRTAARRLGKGTDAYAMHIKGLELPAYEPRGAKANGLSYATSPIGASHCIGYATQELYGARYPRPVDRFADTGYADVVIFNQDQTAMVETGIACTFSAQLGMLRVPLFGQMLAAATGMAEFASPDYLAKVGERIYNVERLFNVREGLGRKDDRFPARLTTEPLKNAGPAEGQVIRKPEEMLDEYYRVRGWDKEGRPLPEKMKELGLN